MLNDEVPPFAADDPLFLMPQCEFQEESDATLLDDWDLFADPPPDSHDSTNASPLPSGNDQDDDMEYGSEDWAVSQPGPAEPMLDDDQESTAYLPTH
jgi:hypothetical protein